MQFNSFAFLIFFPLVAAVYFRLPSRWRWAWLLVASCYFYMYFIPAYLAILGLTIVVDYFAGILIDRAHGTRRKAYLLASIIANVSVLAVFKYFDFFDNNVAALVRGLGWRYTPHGFGLALPIGLSFHTFQAMSYTIEVYRGRQPPERHFGIYALYVMFFPQLVAGPIERPQNLLHQFYEEHHFSYDRVVGGLQLMTWGLLKKVVVADHLARVVDHVYANPSNYYGPTLVTATVFFAFQIYYDFSGYSDIAVGSARVLGFRLMRNFDRPYSATSIADFWRGRWHISLSTWFRDYLYIPLGGNRVPVLRSYANVLIVFLVSGLWHGANWTYAVWGALHGAFLVLGSVTQSIRDRIASSIGLIRLPRLLAAMEVLSTFILVNVGWVFFRASSLDKAWEVFTESTTGWPKVVSLEGLHVLISGLGLAEGRLLIYVGGIVLVEYLEHLKSVGAPLARVSSWPWWSRWSLYYATAAALFFLFAEDSDQFIYFQFLSSHEEARAARSTARASLWSLPERV